MKVRELLFGVVLLIGVVALLLVTASVIPVDQSVLHPQH